MFRFFSVVLLVMASIGLNAQGIQFETGNWMSVLEKAKKEKKMIYMDIYAEWCGPCKQMAKNIFPTQEAGDKYNSLFINYKIDAEKGEGIDLARKYGVTAYPTNLYIDPKTERVVYKAIGGTDLSGFIQRGDFAIAEFNDPMTLEVYQEQFAKGKRDKEFLKNYIAKAVRSDVYADEVLDLYLQKYGEPVNDSSLAFLLDNTMTFDNQVIDFLRNNKQKVNLMRSGVNIDYFSEWLQKLPYHTFQKAIQNKDAKIITLMHQQMMKNEFPTNILGEYGFKLMYLGQTGQVDKANAMNTELMNYLTNLSKKKYEEQNKIELEFIRKSIEQQVKKAGMPDSQVAVIFASTLNEYPEYAYSANFLAAQKLNETAWNIYENKEAGKDELKNAVKWSNKSLSLTENLKQWSIFADTYAHLLYRSGNKKEALKMQEQAVSKAKENELEDLATLQSNLEKMKTGTL